MMKNTYDACAWRSRISFAGDPGGRASGQTLLLVLGIGLVIGSLLIERFDSLEASNLLARKTHVLELPNIRHGRELLSEFHNPPPLVSKPAGRGLYDCQRLHQAHVVVSRHSVLTDSLGSVSLEMCNSIIGLTSCPSFRTLLVNSDTNPRSNA